MSPWQWASPVKTPFILSLVAYLKNELYGPHFLFLKSDLKGKIKLSVKLKKILSSGFRATLIL